MAMFVSACQQTPIPATPSAATPTQPQAAGSIVTSVDVVTPSVTVFATNTLVAIATATTPTVTMTPEGIPAPTLTPRPPGVEITSPSRFDAIRARSKLYFAINAMSPAGISEMTFYINDQPQFTWNAGGAVEFNAVHGWSTDTNGDYRIQVKARDANGNVLESVTVVQSVRGGVDPVVNGTVTVSEIGSMVSMPEGTFIMGDDGGQVDERPQRAVSLSAYEIDQYEITVRQYKDFVTESQHQTSAEADGKPITATWRLDDEPARWDHPVRYVSWWDADSYCRWLGKRLPTEAEWEYAARGSDLRRYPWGSDFDSQRVPQGDTAPVGFYTNGASPFGLYDMSGNVWEWTEDWYDPTAYAASGVRDPRAEKVTDQKAIRGGGYNSSPDDQRVTRRIRNFPTTYHADVGFRCVKGIP